MKKIINDSFLMDLENLSDNDNKKDELSDEDDIFDEKSNKQKKNSQNFSNNTIIISDYNEKLYNSTKLRNNKRFFQYLNEIDLDKNKTIANSNPDQIFKNSNVFKLITESNTFIQDINYDINVISKYIKEIYSKRFPELESQILTPYEYALTVKTLGNEIDVMKKDLSFLPNHNIMAINIVSSTTSGKPLNQIDLNKLNIACDEIIKLNNDRKLILEYIQVRMNLIAPNVCSLIGSNVASKIITAVGGILELAKMPASNILVVGTNKKNLEGFSTAGKLHLGFLAEIDAVKETPEEFKRQVLRRFSNKIALAARIDAFRKLPEVNYNVNNIKSQNGNNNNSFSINSSFKTDKSIMDVDDVDKENNSKNKIENKFETFFDDENAKKKSEKNEDTEMNFPEKIENLGTNIILISDGSRLKDEIAKKMIKIREPKQAKIIKPLPKPDDKPRRTRGGKRIRNAKQRYALTEMRLMKNRMKFGEEAEIEHRETGKGFGMIGIGGNGSKLKLNAKSQKINTKKQNIAKMENSKEIQKSG